MGFAPGGVAAVEPVRRPRIDADYGRRGGVGWLVYRSQPELLHAFWIALPLIPLIAFATLRQAALQGLGRVVLGRFPETIVAPLLFICLAAAAASPWLTISRAGWAVAMQVLATACAFAFGALLLRRHLPAQVVPRPASMRLRAWRRSGLSLALLNVLIAANAQVGTILLGAMSSAADAGLFNVATRTTTFISFISLAVSYPLMPIVARLYASGEIDRLQRIVVRTARGVFSLLACGLVLVVSAPTILGFFGEGFSAGAIGRANPCDRRGRQRRDRIRRCGAADVGPRVRSDTLRRSRRGSQPWTHGWPSSR